MNPAEDCWEIWSFRTKHFRVLVQGQPTHTTMGEKMEWSMQIIVFYGGTNVAIVTYDFADYIPIIRDNDGYLAEATDEQLRDLIHSDAYRDLVRGALAEARKFFFQMPTIRQDPTIKRIAMQALRLEAA